VERWEAIKRFHNAFRFFIQKGSKFPKIAGYSTIVSEDAGVLEHKPGEVTVIILNNSRMADFIKGIVLKNKWEGKIKVIEVRRGER
jgi:hypothetical protein